MLLPGSFSAKIALSVMTKDQKAWNKFIICYLHQTADRKVFLALLKSFRTPWKARTSNLLNAVTKRQVYWCSHFSNFFCEVNPGVLTSPNSSASSCKFIDHCHGRFYSCYCIWELLHKTLNVDQRLSGTASCVWEFTQFSWFMQTLDHAAFAVLLTGPCELPARQQYAWL